MDVFNVLFIHLKIAFILNNSNMASGNLFAYYSQNVVAKTATAAAVREAATLTALTQYPFIMFPVLVSSHSVFSLSSVYKDSIKSLRVILMQKLFCTPSVYGHPRTAVERTYDFC